VSETNFKILGLAGSLRRASFHRGIVRAAHEVAPEWMSCESFDLTWRLATASVFVKTDLHPVTVSPLSSTPHTSYPLPHHAAVEAATV
jgi:NAD(P)H-dependent FMN reductase